MKAILINASWMYTLYEDETGYLLSFTRGTIGLYEVLVRLDANETALFQSEGEDYLTSLARDIAKDDEKYRDRWIARP